MQLTTILLIAVALLTVLAGFSIMVGSQKNERGRSAWFFLTTIGAAAWAVFIALFLSLPEDGTALGPIYISGLYIGAVIMDIGLMFYMCWAYKIGKVMAILFCLYGLFLIGALLYDPSFLYTDIKLSLTNGNSLHMVVDWYYWLYCIFFVLATFILLSTVLYRIGQSTHKRNRIGYIVFLVGFSITGILALIFDILLPVTNYSLIWVGPLAIGTTILSFYYSILRYHILNLSARWMNIFSYIILMMSAAVLYMIIFFLVFSTLFRVTSPSPEVFLLNFIMVLIMLFMIPLINELGAFMKSLIATGQVDVSYIVKKLNNLAPKDANKEELAGFLADHMHFSYVGFLINGKLYGSSSLPISQNELHQVQSLKPSTKGIWQDFNEPVSRIFANIDINAVAELQDNTGKVFGQVLIGKPIGKMKFERKNLVQMEMIINLIALVIGPSTHSRK